VHLSRLSYFTREFENSPEQVKRGPRQRRRHFSLDVNVRKRSGSIAIKASVTAQLTRMPSSPPRRLCVFPIQESRLWRQQCDVHFLFVGLLRKSRRIDDLKSTVNCGPKRDVAVVR
jgi:hypothetical protein